MNAGDREAIAVLEVELKHLAEAIDRLSHNLDTMRRDLDCLKALANRWKGAGIFLVMLGGFGAWAVDAARNMFNGG